MPKINHIIFFTIIAVNISILNAMENAGQAINYDKKNIVIVIEHDGIESNNEYLPSFFDTDQYIIMKSYSASKACTETQFNNQITSIIEGDVKGLKQKNSNRKVYLYADNNFLYTLNYAAQNAHTIDGIILNQPTYCASRPIHERLFNLKLSHIVEQLPNTMPIIIYNFYNFAAPNDKIFKALLVSAKNRTINDPSINTTNHTFSVTGSIKIPAKILQNPKKYYRSIHQLPLSQQETKDAQTIRQEETKFYYIERVILGVGSGFFVFLFHKMGIFYLLYGASTMLLNRII